MIWNMDFKPVAESLAIEQGDGVQYAAHISEIIDEVITNFLIRLSKVGEVNANDEELLKKEAKNAIEQWLKAMREDVNKRNQSVFWGTNLLVLLVKTLDCTKQWHFYLEIIDKQFKVILPKHYKFTK